MAWLNEADAITNKKKVSERRTVDERREGYWYNGNFYETLHQRRTRVAIVERYPAMTESAAVSRLCAFDNDPNSEAVMQERNESDCYDVIVTTTTIGEWADV